MSPQSERKGFETFEEFERKLGSGLFGISGSIGYSIEHARRTGVYRNNNGFEQNVLQVANELALKPVSIERFFENSRSMMGDERFDFYTYTDLFLKVHRQFGHRTGDYFSLAYSDVLKQGVSPQEFFDYVSTAVREGGRIFGSWYAYTLPKVLSVGIKPDEFRVNALRVYKGGRVKVLRPYVLNVPAMQSHEIITKEFADLAEKAIENLGADIASWVIRSMGGLVRVDCDPYKILDDTTRVFEEFGERSAFWYAFGLGGIATFIDSLDKQIRRTQKWNPKTPKGLTTKEDMLREYHREMGSINPVVFRENYLDVLGRTGQSGATFYALVGRNSKTSDEFRQLNESLSELKRKVSKKVFSSAVWFVPKLTTYRSKGISFPAKTSEVVKLLDEITNAFVTLGEEATIDSIKYTCGIRRNGEVQNTLTISPKHSTTDQEDEGFIL